ncbi:MULTISPECIES: TM2 domain-containing protein [unclassified Nocardioides]|uniref:TM2 domain-containing protein n=1 Tax=unclassified Nocardioides TaxID=2615069 RepID=UPI0009E88226|nr:MULTISPECIES: TM2 domain-containing protein [unclassified Nocardioides]
MSQGPEEPDVPPPYGAPTPPPAGETPPPAGDPAPPPYGQAPPPQPGYQQPGQQGYPQQGYPQQAYPGPYGASPQAPYGIHPATGLPYSDKSKLVAGLLQILIPLGIGRFYIGDTKTGVWQLVVTILTCGIGGLWPFIDGIIILATDSKDGNGLPLRTS